MSELKITDKLDAEWRSDGKLRLWAKYDGGSYATPTSLTVDEAKELAAFIAKGPAPECSICRRHHGTEVTHACE